MNSYHNPYFCVYQESTYAPNPYFAALTPTYQQNGHKYIQLLES